MMKPFILYICIFGLTSWLSPVYQNQDMSVEQLLKNLETEQYSGMPIDIDLENAGIKKLFSRLEKFSGLSFELNPDIPIQSLAKKAYSFKHVPWDRILSLVLNELSLEAIPMDGGIYVQPKEENMLQIIREDQLQSLGSSRIPPLLYVLAVFVLIGGATG
ncbi:MAG: hypothetical protein JSV17_11805, partial [Candidatus Aminicenantes bacterium]